MFQLVVYVLLFPCKVCALLISLFQTLLPLQWLTVQSCAINLVFVLSFFLQWWGKNGIVDSLYMFIGICSFLMFLAELLSDVSKGSFYALVKSLWKSCEKCNYQKLTSSSLLPFSMVDEETLTEVSQVLCTLFLHPVPSAATKRSFNPTVQSAIPWRLCFPCSRFCVFLVVPITCVHPNVFCIPFGLPSTQRVTRPTTVLSLGLVDSVRSPKKGLFWGQKTQQRIRLTYLLTFLNPEGT